MANELAKQDEANLFEQVVIGGDLSRLSPTQRVSYYRQVCTSLGLNPLTKPFDYITLNGKLTLYARKDAADQLRKIHGVTIEDVDIRETDSQYIVKVKGHDKTGRGDVEIAVVNKNDMRGDTANAQMKAVTKGKRRLTLSLCGLGMLDETEIETIPTAQAVIVETETGEIVDPGMVETGAALGAKVTPQPAANSNGKKPPTRAGLLARLAVLEDQAEKAGLVLDAFDAENATDAEITERGKAIAALVNH